MAYTCYSVLKLFTGLDIAAFTDWKLTVINAMRMITIKGKTK